MDSNSTGLSTAKVNELSSVEILLALNILITLKLFEFINVISSDSSYIAANLPSALVFT